MKRLIGLCLLLSATVLAGPADQLTGYVEAVVSGDWSAAESFWDRNHLEKSRRLGITYSNVPAKYDCASPLMTFRDQIKAGQISYWISTADSSERSAHLILHLTTATDTVSHTYHAIIIKGRWQLTSAMTVYCSGWDTLETSYVRLIYGDPSQVTEQACRAMDEFIETVSLRFGITLERLQNLAASKIDYFLGSNADIERLTGYVTNGMADLASDAVISRELPHQHELVHLLVNYALGELPLGTMPFMQEGLASHLGGRWGRSPAVMHYVGQVNLKFGLAALADILTFDDFHNKVGDPDVSYPVSAIFVDFLMRLLKPDDFLKLYRSFSSPLDILRALTRNDIQSAIAEASGRPWADLQKGFDGFWPRFAAVGINTASLSLPQDSAIFNKRDSILTAIWDIGSRYLVQVGLRSMDSGVILLLKKAGEATDTAYQSRLFAEHLPGHAYAGYHYGIRCTPAEIGLYDYWQNLLLASFVFGFAADSTTAPVIPSGTLSFYLEQTVLGADRIQDFEIKVVEY